MRLSATRLSATGGNKGQLPFNKFISALLSKSGCVAAYYGESWDEILAYNAVQIAAGTPANCVAFEDSSGTIPLVAPLGSGKGCGILKDRSGGSNHRIQTSATARGEMSRRVNRLTGTETLATQSITTIATSSILSFSGAGSIALSGAATGTYSAGTHSITTTAGTLTLTVSGTVTQADCRYSADAGIGKTYQRVTSASDYDEEGFPAFLRRQTDDWSKAHINPNGATKVFVLTAIQRMSDVATGVPLESSVQYSSNSGTLAFISPASGNADYSGFASRGTSSAAAYYTLPAPARTVSRMGADIAGGEVYIAANLQSIVKNNLSMGSGAYTEQDFYFGSRAGVSLFVNDREYSPPLILFMQPSDPGLTDSEIARLTAQFNKSIKAY